MSANSAAGTDPMDGTDPMENGSSELEELRARHAELEVLYQTVRDLSSTLAVHEVIERLLDRILLHLDSEIGSVLLLDADARLRIVHSRGLPENLLTEAAIATNQGISGYVLSAGESLLVPDIETDPRFQRRNHERYYTNSFISAPLVFDGEVRGVLNVNNKSNRKVFSPEDLSLLEAIAGHAAAALHNAKRYEDMLQRAQRDALTGLLNHGRFWSGLEEELKRSQRYERPFSVIMLDIDHFKRFNDRWGHLEGDGALIAVASEISRSARSHDLVARYGGEEFSVILPETDRKGATIFADKIRGAVDRSDFGLEAGLILTVSAGLATYPDDGDTGLELVRNADNRLYRAKALGRNRVCSMDPQT